MIFFKTWSVWLMYILLPCSFPSTYYDWQRLECYIFQNEFANVNFSSIRRQFAIVQFTDSFVCSFSVLDLMYFFSIIIMFQWFKNHFTLKLSLVKVGFFFFSLSFRVRWLVISRFSQSLLLWKEVVVFCLQTIFFLHAE